MSALPRKRNKHGVYIDAKGKLDRTMDGVVFDSLAELRRYRELKLLQRAGQIKDLRAHVKYPMAVNGQAITSYEADFVYTDLAKNESYPVGRGRTVVEDVKGRKKNTDAFIIKKKLLLALHGITINEIRYL